MHSMGETTATASVIPAPRPARKTDEVATFPVDLSASIVLYASKEENRMAILGTIPATTAPNPLYSASGDSFLTMSFPTVKKPRFLACC